ncbi:MAG: glycosyltransferase [Candidatus Bathyarchaeota archaeon]|nr:glycosyltransferase [Candidatus Bathyarchaeota archaeon]MDH5787818.1 glycosyltransferase [Candidatus Bathyarchaeota archaeon]
MSIPRIAVGICAYNEENNIGRVLHRVLEQDLPENSKILVVCSGCTDRTPQIVEEFQKKDSRIELLTESVRTGKANALNKIFKIAKKSAEMLVLVNADALPNHGSIERLISKLTNDKAGAVFAQPVPFENVQGFSYRIACVIWRLHHLISLLQRPKLSGELCVIRTSCLQEIPENVATDEPYIELSIRKQGYDIAYAPDALVYIRCPTSVVDLLKHRERILAGHMQLQTSTGFRVSTSSLRNIMLAVSALKPSEIIYASLGGFLEVIAYVHAKIAFGKLASHVWEPIKSTKISI